MKKEKSKNTGLTLDIVIAAIFVVLKLTGLINWSWFWVLSPLWISLIASLVIIGITTYFAFLRYRNK